jgi:hypothetical protein
VTFTGYVELAAQGKCIICRRRLPKIRISLYNASAPSWLETETGLVEVAVCSGNCLNEYNEGKVPA